MHDAQTTLYLHTGGTNHETTRYCTLNSSPIIHDALRLQHMRLWWLAERTTQLPVPLKFAKALGFDFCELSFVLVNQPMTQSLKKIWTNHVIIRYKPYAR